MSGGTGIPGEDDNAPILQREAELRRVKDGVDDACAGRGRVMLVLAGAGLGKTTVLHEAAELARASGMRVLHARGSELERDMSFGVARQLFETEVASLSDSERDQVLAGAAELAAPVVSSAGGKASADPRGVIHGLQWLATNLADQRPTLLALDDLHWSDDGSLRWVAYLASRITTSALLVVGCARPSEPGADRGLVTALAADAAVDVIGLDPLREPAVEQLVSMSLGADPDAEFVRACRGATGGNPFFLHELLRAAADDGITPVAVQAPFAARRSTAQVRRSILMRLERLGEAAQRLAQATAVLGSDARVRHAAGLSDLHLDDAQEAADRLADAGILRPSRPLEFVHPIVRAAVYDQLAPGERSRAHRRAAAQLADDGSSAEHVASHALACEPAGDADVVGWLREAARSAVGKSAPDAAARYLRRALDEPPAASLRPDIHFDLGQALVGIDVVGAAEHFAHAAAAGEGPLRVLAHRWRAQALGFGGDPGGAVRAVDEALAGVADDPELRLLLEGTRDFYALGWTGDPCWTTRSQQLRRRAVGLVGATPAQRRTLAVAAFDIARTGDVPADQALDYATRVRTALATWLDADDGVETAAGIGQSSIIGDDPEALSRHDRARAESARRGRFTNTGAAYAQTAHIRYRLGALPEGEADARTSWQLLRGERGGAASFYWWSLGQLLDVLIARGALDEAVELVNETGAAAEPLERTCTIPVPAPVPVVLGALALARGQIDEGIESLTWAGTWLEDRGWVNPAVNPWRIHLAPALARAGRADEARAVIAPAVERARRFGAPWALGAALRAAGTVEQGDPGGELLREAIRVLGPAGCRLEQAHALLELGATTRRANQRVEAREHLRTAVELLHRCGATPLARRAEEELAATGARPRRVMFTGLESLTASERRIAALAAGGRSNPEIAQTLFVTRKTVETHLSHVYMKLDIASREQLGEALAT
jgi:DNA-binding CsgD family transcriptional regulator